MKQIIILSVISAMTFLASVVVLIIGILKRKKRIVFSGVGMFLLFAIFASWTGYSFITKSYRKVSTALKPRTGDEIYNALFGKPETDCVHVVRTLDQVIPIMDYAILLHFKTCPAELKRILSQRQFSSKMVSANSWEMIMSRDSTHWFNPALLGDTVMLYEYSSESKRNMQTIWATRDSTQVYCKDFVQ